MAELVVVTCAVGSRDNANEIARALVDGRLAACVQLTPVESHYRWEGVFHQEPELLLQIKTTIERLAEVEAAIKRLHLYELPEVLALAVLHASPEYTQWVEQAVAR